MSALPAVAFFSFHVMHVGLGCMIGSARYPAILALLPCPYYYLFFFCLGLLPSKKGFNINKRWKTLQFHSATPFVSFFPFLLLHVGRMIWSAYILSILVFSCSAHYLFAWGWIFLDLWVSSSALLLNCMCFFDFMFPFQVTAFGIWPLHFVLEPRKQLDTNLRIHICILARTQNIVWLWFFCHLFERWKASLFT